MVLCNLRPLTQNGDQSPKLLTPYKFHRKHSTRSCNVVHRFLCFISSYGPLQILQGKGSSVLVYFELPDALLSDTLHLDSQGRYSYSRLAGLQPRQGQIRTLQFASGTRCPDMRPLRQFFLLGYYMPLKGITSPRIHPSPSTKVQNPRNPMKFVVPNGKHGNPGRSFARSSSQSEDMPCRRAVEVLETYAG